MKTLFAALLAACIGLVAASVSAQPTDTLAKIRSSKSAVMGVRDSSAPLSYALGSNSYAGYHVELCERILNELVPGIQLSYVPVTSANRVPLVKNGTIDIECGSTTNTDGRQKDVAFAVTTYIAEIRMAVKVASGIRTVSQLEGKRVVSTTGGTGITMMKKLERTNNLKFDQLYGRDHADSFLMLETSRADAFMIDDNVLAGLIALAQNPKDFAIVGETLSVDPNAIMIRRDDPAFKQAVDGIVIGMMRSGELEKLYAKWFLGPIPPRNVNVNLPMGAALRAAFKNPSDKSVEEYNK